MNYLSFQLRFLGRDLEERNKKQRNISQFKDLKSWVNILKSRTFIFSHPGSVRDILSFAIWRIGLQDENEKIPHHLL